MKPYKVEIEFKTKWTMEVHGTDEESVRETVKNMNHHQIEDGGDFEEILGIEVLDVVDLDPPDDEEPERVPNAETLAAIEELESGGGEFVDLNSLLGPEEGETEEEPDNE